MGVVPPREPGPPKHQPLIVGGQDGRYRPEGFTSHTTSRQGNPEVTFDNLAGGRGRPLRLRRLRIPRRPRGRAERRSVQSRNEGTGKVAA